MVLPLPPEPSQWQMLPAAATSGRLSLAAQWYFAQEWVAVEPTGTSAPPRQSPPFWIAAPELRQQQRLNPENFQLGDGADDGPAVSVKMRVTPPLASNPVFINGETLRYLAMRPLRVRGTLSGDTLQARTLWPEDWRIQNSAQVLHGDWRQLIARGEKGAQQPFTCHRLWSASAIESAPVPTSRVARWAIGFMLNGAQGDDDEAHGGHFALILGRWRDDGDIADWLVANFYNPDVVSEKGILPALVPMDNYLTDVNSGQQQYRPSWLVTCVLEDEQLASALYVQLVDTVERLYDHRLHYQHTDNNCTGLSMDALRAAGIRVPLRGPSSRLLAPVLYASTLMREHSVKEAAKASRYLLAEQTRLMPWQAFESCVEHVLALLTGNLAPTSEMEAVLKQHTHAVYGLHFPQLPSARPWGREPAESIFDYQRRVPAKRADWKIIPVPARELPAELHHRVQA